MCSEEELNKWLGISSSNNHGQIPVRGSTAPSTSNYQSTANTRMSNTFTGTGTGTGTSTQSTDNGDRYYNKKRTLDIASTSDGYGKNNFRNDINSISKKIVVNTISYNNCYGIGSSSCIDNCSNGYQNKSGEGGHGDPR